MAMAKQQFGKWMDIWKADDVSLKQKLLLFGSGVVARLVHAHESWELDPALQASLRAWGARCMCVITGAEMTAEEIKGEYRTPTYDIVGKLRARRLKWVGQLLRKEPGSSMARDVLEKTAMICLLYTSPSPRDRQKSRMPSSA